MSSQRELDSLIRAVSTEFDVNDFNILASVNRLTQTTEDSFKLLARSLNDYRTALNSSVHPYHYKSTSGIVCTA